MMSINQTHLLSRPGPGLVLRPRRRWRRSSTAPAPATPRSRSGRPCPYSGPASAYGIIGKVQAAYFKMINEAGGINGRKINYISLDDGYSPPKAVEMVRGWWSRTRCCSPVSTLGTPVNSAIHKYMNQKKVPHLFLATGASKWNDPKNFPWTMGFNPNYQSEGKLYAQDILRTKPNAKIAVLYQNDDYGKDYLKGFMEGLGDKAKKMIVKTRRPTK
jgi:branched-chain amino acid transport system substrate-binding protein